MTEEKEGKDKQQRSPADDIIIGLSAVYQKPYQVTISCRMSPDGKLMLDLLETKEIKE